MNLQEVFPKKHMIADLKASQKLDTLQEIVAALAAAGVVKASDVEDIERAIKLSHEKYCPAINMFNQISPITHRYEIIK